MNVSLVRALLVFAVLTSGGQVFAYQSESDQVDPDTVSYSGSAQGGPAVKPGRFPGGSSDPDFCAGPDRSVNGGSGSNRSSRAKKRRRQIRRLKQKYLPDQQFSILKPGAIQGARTMEDPWTVETRHYLVKTDISRKATGEIAFLMEVLHDSLLRSSLIPDRDHELERVQVQVAKNREEFSEITPKNHGSDVKGTVADEEGSSVIYTYYHTGEEGRHLNNVLFYHGTRQFLDEVADGRLPLWLYEGISRFFEHSKLEEVRLVPGRIVRRHVYEINEELQFQGPGPYEYLKPFHALLRMEDEFVSDEDSAQTWGVLHFLMYWNDGKLSEPLARHVQHYLSVDSVKRDPVQLFQKHFGFHPDKLRRPWEKYIFNMPR